MRRFRKFFAPLVFALISAAAAGDSGRVVGSGGMPQLLQAEGYAPQFKLPFADWRPPTFRQVRIERHFVIRITPGTAMMPPAVVEELEDQERAERLAERRIGKCLEIGAIAAVRPGDGDELLLFLHDQRIISLKLEKRCNARAFYSGFYVARNADGAICAGRDTLQSRSGTNCQVKRLNEVVPAGYRRFP